MSPRARISLACWPGLTHLAAAQAAMRGASEPLLGDLLADHVQLVPQGAEVLDEGLAEVLAQTWPTTAFRLHANVRVLPQRRLADLCTFERDRDWFVVAARVHRALGATAYSAHAGLRRDAGFGELLDNARRCADLFGCDVAIDGQYPVAGDEPHRLLLSTWAEYRALLDSDAPFALDLSHLNILAHRSRRCEDTLVAEMLASAACTIKETGCDAPTIERACSREPPVADDNCLGRHRRQRKDRVVEGFELSEAQASTLLESLAELHRGEFVSPPELLASLPDRS